MVRRGLIFLVAVEFERFLTRLLFTRVRIVMLVLFSFECEEISFKEIE